ncbi:hypothetical protein [Burkholderia humptydooensis]|uniref:hypothetical protein n=1 Tax=Burkholderia humptydooensis TaxID=430531 RepID=UPI001428B78B
MSESAQTEIHQADARQRGADQPVAPGIDEMRHDEPSFRIVRKRCAVDDGPDAAPRPGRRSIREPTHGRLASAKSRHEPDRPADIGHAGGLPSNGN